MDTPRILGGATDTNRRFGKNALAVSFATGVALLLAALPIAMVLANRSAPLFVSMAAIAAIGGVLARGGWVAVRSTAPKLWRSQVARATLLALALSLVSILWSVDRTQTLRTFGEAVIPLFGGGLLLLFLPQVAPRWTGRAMAVGVILAAAICIGDMALDMPIRSALHLRAKQFEYNRSVLTLLVLLWPICALAMSRHGASTVYWIAILAATIAIWASYSGTAMFAQLVSVIAAFFSWRHPRTSLSATAIVFGITFLSVFAFGDVARHVLPEGLVRALAWTHAVDRLEIWQSYGAAMLLHPVLGTGFGTSVTLGDTAVASEVASQFRRMLSVGHPHNGFLQIGVELGMLGCLFALTILLLLLRSWAGLRGTLLWPRIGLLAMVAATMLVGHGAWQAWWIATVFTGAALMRTLIPIHDKDLAHAVPPMGLS